MESDKTGSTTDRDRNLMSSFESYADTPETKEKKTKKSKKAKSGTAEKETKYEAADKDQKKDVPKKLDELFEPKKPDESQNEKLDPLEPLAPEADLETLASDEKQLTTEVIIDAHKQEAEAELAAAEPGSVEAEEAKAALKLMENIAEEFEDSGELDDETLDSAEASTIEEMSLDDAEAPDETIIEAPEAADDGDDDDEVSAPSSPGGGSSASGSGSSSPPVVPPIPPLPSPPPPPSPSPGAGSGRPPVGPAGPYVPLGPSSPSSSPDAMPRSTIVERVTRPSRRGTDLLVGGIIGYMIGRRGGRLRTEAKLMPVQKKLEKQVKDLEYQVEAREQKIRQLARQKFKAKRPDRPAEAAERPPVREAAEQVEKPADKPSRAERLARTILPAAAGLRPPVAPEARPAVPIERPTADQPARRQERSQEARPSQAPSAERLDKAVTTMTKAELLQVAAIITVSGESVKRLHETGRLDDIGLRKAVGEFLQGNNVERVVSESLNRPAESPERLRENQSYHSNNTGSSNGQQTASDYTTGTLPPVDPINAAMASADQLLAQARRQTKASKSRRQRQTAVALVVIVLAVLLILFL